MTVAEDKKRRMNFDVHPRVKAEIIEYQKTIVADSMVEAIRRAVQSQLRLVKELQPGEKLIIRDPQGREREILIVY